LPQEFLDRVTNLISNVNIDFLLQASENLMVRLLVVILKNDYMVSMRSINDNFLIKVLCQDDEIRNIHLLFFYKVKLFLTKTTFW